MLYMYSPYYVCDDLGTQGAKATTDGVLAWLVSCEFLTRCHV